MLTFERRVATALLRATDPVQRERVLRYVDDSLAAMPEILRAGLAGLTVALGPWSRARTLAGAGRSDRDLIEWLEGHPLGLVRQWLRALRSLVLFAEEETMAEAAA
jgi:hypothetical protein